MLKLIAFLMVIIPFIAIIIIDRYRKDNFDVYSKYCNDGSKISKLAKKIGADYKKNNNQLLSDLKTMRCFTYIFYPTFNNVIEKKYNENNRLYIGDLSFNQSIGYSQNVYTTLCLLYNDNFNLPDFDLSNETFEKKLSEVFKTNLTEDIDFPEDKQFSDAWWFTSSENILAMELFSKDIRSFFMKYAGKGYRICGCKNLLIILSEKTIDYSQYTKVISDIEEIQRVFKTNKKFYSEIENKK